ncbi:MULTISPECIES: hypothetical protein [Sphingomonas]|jgi:hypothetical protein|uniref:hypothetical protein n=1 Tax=Sphingomonas TaxID=13687 RepID=UPI0017B411F9|nr:MULTISPECIES: hypothetical protein [Sphingomonas]MBB4047779.1 hypothetical protein [Sphingomonas zeae]MDK8185515.1 hypothetical protein [Sphingomonas zeae]MDK8216738.1 hypothetical protein [Sphingomonas sp. UMB7805-LC452B]
MTDFLSSIRDIAMQLPGTAEEAGDGDTRFLVEGKPFLRVSGTSSAIHLRAADKDREPQWNALTLTADSDWTLIEDQIARSWELVAPTELLEAGGR